MLHSIDTSNIALVHRYDEIPYDALPHRATHPSRLASVATFVGHLAPRAESCSLLEVGCNDGANLIPMAVSLPGARFVGCDLSPRAIEQGRRTISALGLTNIVLVEADLATLASEHGEFDFIVAHGVYSWVPAPVRDALFALAAERLAPDGILYVSFNVLPGCRVRQAAWDILHHHVDHIESAKARLDAARQLARLIADGGAATLESDQAVRAELRAIAQRSDSELCHDDLAVPNEPVLFHSFAEHAERHDLRYLAEAELPHDGLHGRFQRGAGVPGHARARRARTVPRLRSVAPLPPIAARPPAGTGGPERALATRARHACVGDVRAGASRCRRRRPQARPQGRSCGRRRRAGAQAAR
jgi:SAM-dependent methyltransferase